MISVLAYRFTADAQSDLIKIRSYTLKQWDREQSGKYLSELRQTVRLLSEAPTMGKRRLDISSGVFSFPYVSHVWNVLCNMKLESICHNACGMFCVI